MSRCFKNSAPRPLPSAARAIKARPSGASATSPAACLRASVQNQNQNQSNMLRVRCLRGGSRGAEAAHLIGAMVNIARSLESNAP